MTVRLMNKQDVVQVEEIEKQNFSEPWSAQAFLDTIKKKRRFYFVAVEDGVIQGYCGMWDVAGEGQITHVAVDKGYRRRGVAKAMLREMLEIGLSNGITAFTLEVRVSNQPAIELYKSQGFEEAGIRRDFYDLPKEDAVIMWKHCQI